MSSRILCSLLLCSFLTSSAPAQEMPATLEQVRKAVDWPQLPKPEDASRFACGLSNCSFATKLSFSQVAEFFAKALPPLGWVEDKEPIPGVNASRKDYLSMQFDKDGMYLGISGYKDQMSGLNQIMIQNSGNVDVRKLPKFPGAQFKNDLRASQYYFTASKPEEVAAFYRKELPPLNWREVEDYSAKFHAKEGRTILHFVQNAMEINMTIWINKDKQTEATCFSSARHSFEPEQIKEVFCAKEMATPAKLKDCLEVIDMRKLPLMDKAQKLDHDKKMTVLAMAVSYQAPGTVTDAAKFYRKALGDMGWKEIPPVNDMDKMLTLKFEKAGYLVSVGASEYDKPGFVTVAVVNHSNVDIRQLPYPPGAEIHPTRDEFVNINTTLTKEEAFDFYRKELPKLGWKGGGTRGGALMTFVQNDVELRIEIQTDSHDKTAVQLREVLLGGVE
jgi:hypothetical protein